jgi:hypothetical protein
MNGAAILGWLIGLPILCACWHAAVTHDDGGDS